MKLLLQNFIIIIIIIIIYSIYNVKSFTSEMRDYFVLPVSRSFPSVVRIPR